MSDHTAIEWTDATWNPIVGCSVLSPGCKRCYAMKLAWRFAGQPNSPYFGLVEMTSGGPVWNGQIRVVESALSRPLSWRKPRRIFVNSMGDLMHENIDDATIDRVFDVMERADWHTFQVLTKRAERLREYMYGRYGGRPRPRNVWVGVSAEDKRRWGERVPLLLDTPAAKRFVSVEPMIGPIPFGPIGATVDGLDWVICGGESGPEARPMHPQWARAVRDACVRGGVAFFFKQWGAWEPRVQWCPHAPMIAINLDGRETPYDVNPDGVGGQRFERVGKKDAGRLLDGRTHDEFPT